MAFRRSAVRSRLAPPNSKKASGEILKPFFFFLLAGTVDSRQPKTGLRRRAAFKGNKITWSRVNFSKAPLLNANLTDTKFEYADLTEAYVAYGNLTGAVLPDTLKDLADFSFATWTDGSKCGLFSLGACF